MNISSVLQETEGLDLLLFIKGFFHATAELEGGEGYTGNMVKVCEHSWDKHNVDWEPFAVVNGVIRVGEVQ